MIGIYVRVSTREQAREGYSISEQTERLESYCSAMGWEYKIYSDPGHSGAKIDRPALNDLIRSVKNKQIDKVIVYKLDRLSRSQKHTLFLIEDVFLANGVDFMSLSENFDTATPLGRAMIGILAVFAQLEREQIKERLTMGREARAKQGLYSGNKSVVTGYDYKDGYLVINEYEATVIREMFRLFNSGTPIKTTAEILNERGLTVGAPWVDKKVKDLLTNRHLIGYVKFDGIWYKGIHEPILDLETFENAQGLLKQRADYNRSIGRSNEHTSPLTGLLYCKRCGARYSRVMWRPKQDGTREELYSCYSRSKKQKKMVVDPNCKNRNYKRDELDEIIFGEIRKLRLDPSFRSSVSKNTDNSAIEREIEALGKQIERLVDLYSLGAIDYAEIDKRIKPLTEKRSKLSERLGVAPDAESVSNAINSFDDVLKNGNMHEIRLVVSTLINRIEIDGEDIDIYWNL